MLSTLGAYSFYASAPTLWNSLPANIQDITSISIFKKKLTILLRGREYDSQSALDRQLLAYVLIPVVQHESDIFVRYWKSHGIRVQDKLEIPAKVPDYIFSFPGNYGGTNMGIPLHIAFIWFVVLFRQNLVKICKDSPGQRKLFIQSQF